MLNITNQLYAMTLNDLENITILIIKYYVSMLAVKYIKYKMHNCYQAIKSNSNFPD